MAVSLQDKWIKVHGWYYDDGWKCDESVSYNIPVVLGEGQSTITGLDSTLLESAIEIGALLHTPFSQNTWRGTVTKLAPKNTDGSYIPIECNADNYQCTIESYDSTSSRNYHAFSKESTSKTYFVYIELSNGIIYPGCFYVDDSDIRLYIVTYNNGTPCYKDLPIQYTYEDTETKPKNPIYAQTLNVGNSYDFGYVYPYNANANKVGRYIARVSSGSNVRVLPMYCLNYANDTIGFDIVFVSDLTFTINYKGENGQYTTDLNMSYSDLDLGSYNEQGSTASQYTMDNNTFYYDRVSISIMGGITSLSSCSENNLINMRDYKSDAYFGNSDDPKIVADLIISNGYQIGETDNWLCNGTEVAPFPDTHLFKVLAEVSGNIVLMASDKPAEYVLHDSSGDTLVFDGSANGTMYVYDVSNMEWVLQGSATVSTYPVGGTITWSNYILNRKATADSTEVEEIPRDTMIGGTTYDGAEYFETPDTGGSGGDNESGNTGGGGEVTVTFDTQAFLNGLICGLLGKGV